MFSWNLREATRSVHVSYPVPFIATLLIAGGLCLLGVARVFDGTERLLIVGLGCLTVVSAVAIILKAVFFTPALLKSERYVLLDRVIDLLGDPDVEPGAREKLHTRMIEGLSGQWLEKPSRAHATGRPNADEEGKES